MEAAAAQSSLAASLYGGWHAVERYARERGARVARLGSNWATSFAVIDEAKQDGGTIRRVALRGAAWRAPGVSHARLWAALSDARPERLSDSVCHGGLLRVAEEVWPEVGPYLQHRPGGSEVQLTGHSAGGSLALLVGLLAISRGAIWPESIARVDAFGSPACLGCAPEGEGMDALAAFGLPARRVMHYIHRNDPVGRLWLAQDPLWKAVCGEEGSVVRSILDFRGNFLQPNSLFTSSRFLYEPCGVIVLVDSSGAGVEEVSPRQVQSKLELAHLSVLDLPAALDEHSAWRYARTLASLAEMEVPPSLP